MKGKVFLVHWREAAAEVLANEIRHMCWDVEIESNDGEKVGPRLTTEPADVVVIYLTRLPSHGRETGHTLKEMKAFCNIPLVYVDGNDEAVAKTRNIVPDAVYTTTEKLERALMGFCDFHA